MRGLNYIGLHSGTSMVKSNYSPICNLCIWNLYFREFIFYLIYDLDLFVYFKIIFYCLSCVACKNQIDKKQPQASIPDHSTPDHKFLIHGVEKSGVEESDISSLDFSTRLFNLELFKILGLKLGVEMSFNHKSKACQENVKCFFDSGPLPSKQSNC